MEFEWVLWSDQTGFVPCLQKQDTLEIERRYIFKKLPFVLSKV